MPEKDGILAGLLVTEMIAVRGWTLGEQLQGLFCQSGFPFSVRENFHLTAEAKDKFTEKLKTDLKELADRKVSNVVRTDGLKLIFEDGSGVCHSAVWNGAGGARVYGARTKKIQGN